MEGSALGARVEAADPSAEVLLVGRKVSLPSGTPMVRISECGNCSGRGLQQVVQTKKERPQGGARDTIKVHRWKEWRKRLPEESATTGGMGGRSAGGCVKSAGQDMMV
jgi:hypothetical protein